MSDVVVPGLDDSGWFACSAEGDVVVPLDPRDLASRRELTAETLMTAGVAPSDRVVVAMNSDGAGVGAAWAEAATLVAAAACAVGPRQPERLRNVLGAIRASVLCTTPTVARRLLRLLRSQGVDPCHLGLRLVVLSGEIVGRSLHRAVGAGFGADVREVWADPVFGVAMASRAPLVEATFSPTRPGVLQEVAVDRARDRRGFVRSEWVVNTGWAKHSTPRNYRSGMVGRATAGPCLGAPRWTIGDRFLLRGRWVSMGVIDAALTEARPDSGWRLAVDRHLDGDRAELRVSADAVDDCSDVLHEMAPIHIPVVAGPVSPGTRQMVDHRGQHLGPRRSGASR